MQPKLLFRLAAVLSVIAALGVPSAKADYVRLCSEGYFYAGDDNAACPKSADGGPIASRSYWTEEVGTSPTYSCYRHAAGRGFNDAYGECRKSKESEIVAFENDCEAKRFFRQVALNKGGQDRDHGRTKSMTVLTSALYFADVKKWAWLGSDPNENPVTYPISMGDKVTNQCLVVTGTWKTDRSSSSEEDEDADDDIRLEWKAVPCNSNVTFACETRSRTVTTITWFYTNWITLSLMFLVMVLIISLCLSAMTHTTRSARSSQQQRTPFRLSSPSTLNPPRGVVGVVTADPAGDDPPKYSDVAGLEGQASATTTTAEASGKTNMDRYFGKGRELLGKIYLYKPGN